jgi:dTDP-4-dehydrorhamnose reductase
MERILLIGGTGILGSEVFVQLQKNHYEFMAPHSSELDIQEKTELSEYVEQFKPDWIINCAAWTNVDGAEEQWGETLRLNADAVQYLSEVGLKSHCRIVHISTDYVFDGDSDIPYVETDSTHPINAYGESKLQGELKLRVNLEEDSFVIRTSWLYGPSGKNFAKTLIRKALSGESAQVVDDQFGTPTSAIDLANAIVELIKNPSAPGIYHFSNLGESSWFEFAQTIYRLVGVDPELVLSCSTAELNQRTRRPRYSVLSKKKWIQSGVSNILPWQDSLELSIPNLIQEVRKEFSL